MQKFKIQGDRDTIDNIDLYWSNENGWGHFDTATTFNLSKLAQIDLPLHSVSLSIAILDNNGKIEKVYNARPDRNLKLCSRCGALTSFERFDPNLPPEGEVCTNCGKWCCPECVVYPKEAPYCQDCMK